MSSEEMSRRSLIRATAWSLPVIAVTAATPMTAASAAGDWVITAMVAGYQPNALDPQQWLVHATFLLSRTDGGDVAAGGSVTVTLNTGFTQNWFYNAGPSPRVLSIPIEPLPDLNAVTLTVTVRQRDRRSVHHRSLSSRPARVMTVA